MHKTNRVATQKPEKMHLIIVLKVVIDTIGIRKKIIVKELKRKLRA